MMSRNSTTDPGQPWEMTRGSGRGTAAPLMNVVDVYATHRCLEMREAVEPLLLSPPVEGFEPVRAELPHVVEVGAIVPATVVRHLVPSVGGNLRTNAREHLVGHPDAKRSRCRHVGYGVPFAGHRPPLVRGNTQTEPRRGFRFWIASHRHATRAGACRQFPPSRNTLSKSPRLGAPVVGIGPKSHRGMASRDVSGNCRVHAGSISR